MERDMARQFELSIARIHTADGAIVGAGFLVTEQQVLTCAHVVTRALNSPNHVSSLPQAEVHLDFPLVAPGDVLIAKVIRWYPKEDVAVLRLNGNPPTGVQAARLVVADELWEHPFRALGFPKGHDAGVWTAGVLRGRQATNWVQIEDVKVAGFRVQPGFSGAPVWDEQLGGVVGMAVAAERQPDVKAAFIIPTKMLIAIWPELAHLLQRETDFLERISLYARSMMGWRRLQHLDRFQIPLFAECKSQRVPLVQLLEDHARLVITGSPGSGKTVFVLQTLSSFCRTLNETLEREAEHSAALTVPIYIELGLLVPTDVMTAFNVHQKHSLVGMILDQLGISPTENPTLALRKVLDGCNLILLLDGLNELTKDHRARCAKELLALDQELVAQGKGKQVQIVLTSRSYGFIDYFSQYGYTRAEILPLLPQDIESELMRIPAGSLASQSLFQQVDAKTRQLLSNPQHLDYVVQWCQDQLGAGHSLKGTLRTKGELLRYFCDKKLNTIDRQKSRLIEDVLRKLGYQTAQTRVYSPVPDVLEVINKTLHDYHSSIDAESLLDEILYTGLLEESRDHCRFLHHSIQQYFAACQMKNLWKLDEYIASELWHEPLVIMAGVLDRSRLLELLKRVRTNHQLFAYILANIHEPDTEKTFLNEITGHFVGKTQRWARQLAQILILYAIIWFFLLPLLAYFLAVSQAQSVQLLLSALGIAYLLVLPSVLLWWHKKQFRHRVERLVNWELPNLIIVLRFLMARGAMNIVRKQLISLRDTMIGYQEEDPRVAFVNESIAAIEQAVDSPSYMTEDEMLEHISDPLVAAAIDPERLSARGIALLRTKALDPKDKPGALKAMDLLRELYTKYPEEREQIASLFQEIASGSSFLRWQRKHASRTCQRLGITLPSSYSWLQRIFSNLISVLKRIWPI